MYLILLLVFIIITILFQSFTIPKYYIHFLTNIEFFD